MQHQPKQDEATLLYEAMLHASHKHLKQLLCDLIEQAPSSLVSSLLQRAYQLGLIRVQHTSMSKWELLSANLIGSVLQYLEDFERLLLAERVCRRWRNASLNGAGWLYWTISKRIALVPPYYISRLAKSSRMESTHSLDAEWLHTTQLHWLSCLRLKHLRLDVDLFDDEDMKQLLPLAPTLERLELLYEPQDLTEHGLTPLKALTKLQSIELHTSACNEQLRALSALPLTDVHLESDLVTASGLDHLPQTLVRLYMSVPQLCGNEMLHLQRFPSLTKLYLSWEHKPPVWKQCDLETFLNLPCCKQGTLKHLGVTLTQVKPSSIIKLAFLDILELSLMHPTDEQAEALSRTCNVSWLELFDDANGALTDTGLMHIGRLPKLDMLWLEKLNAISDSGLAHLQHVQIHTLKIAKCSGITGQVKLLSSMSKLERLKLSDVVDEAQHNAFRDTFQRLGGRARLTLQKDDSDSDDDSHSGSDTDSDVSD